MNPLTLNDHAKNSYLSRIPAFMEYLSRMDEGQVRIQDVCGGGGRGYM